MQEAAGQLVADIQSTVASAHIQMREVLQVLSALFGLLSALFELRDRAQTTSERQKTREWYGRKWLMIQQSTLLSLPEIVIGWVVALFDWMSLKASSIFNRLAVELLVAAVLIGPILGVIALWKLYGGIAPFWIPGSILFLLWYVAMFGSSSEVRGISAVKAPRNLIWAVYFLIAIVSVISYLLFIQLVLMLPILWSALILIAMLPISVVTIASPISLMGIISAGMTGTKGNRAGSAMWILGMSVAVSLPLTATSLAIGAILAPGAAIPRALQLIISNVLFDGLTVLTTIALLKRSLDPQSSFPIWLAVLIDVLSAAVFACLALWLGLLFSANEISLRASTLVLFGMSPDGATFQLGPLFWAMHTTLIPTLFYAILTFMALVGKVLILPVATLFRKGVAVRKPHRLTAGVFFFMAALCYALSRLVGLG